MSIDNRVLTARVHTSVGPDIIEIGRSFRDDPLTPYITHRDTDVDDRGYHPGGQRIDSADLVLPATGLDNVIGVVLRFTDPDDVLDVMNRLHGIRERLSKRFTDDDFRDLTEDEAVKANDQMLNDHIDQIDELEKAWTEIHYGPGTYRSGADHDLDQRRWDALVTAKNKIGMCLEPHCRSIGLCQEHGTGSPRDASQATASIAI
ncbi:hypothetical protein [Streptosporangium sp. NPDC051022]|uniref:hypothetical protein n=1 Tax=Streptosporangium sp. NPDC051022 TaxID=3155752 RepID=UPI0034410B61